VPNQSLSLLWRELLELREHLDKSDVAHDLPPSVKPCFQYSSLLQLMQTEPFLSGFPVRPKAYLSLASSAALLISTL
jgi:hypothetical protein